MAKIYDFLASYLRLPDDWPNQNAPIFGRCGTIFVKLMSDSSGELKLEPDMLGSHGHLFDTLPTAVLGVLRVGHVAL